MSDAAKLQFLPWMRRGLVRALAEPADSNGVPVSDAGSVEAAVTVGETEVARKIHVRQPSAVIGLNAVQIVREEPKSGTSDFEINYFPFVELASPDLPWQFTPAAPNDDRLMPWLVLVVVPEREGVAYSELATGPLPVLSLADNAGRELPKLREAWAWTHGQASTEISAGVDAAFSDRPEAFVARLMCPRVLDTDTWYRACLVPGFEQGRQAGLGWNVTAEPTMLAWSDTTERLDLPVYHTWRFRTSQQPGDFESLVKRLKARTLDEGVGVHDLDIGDPGSERLPRAPGTIVAFQGALVSPRVVLPEWDEDHMLAFQRGLRRMLNQALAAQASSDDPKDGSYRALLHDPVVAPPAYGALPADVDEIPATGQDPEWLGEANLDGGLRATSGLGAEVVRRNQEMLVAEAWDQAGAISEVNRTLNHARLALEVGQRMKLQLDTMEDGALLQLTRGAHARIKRGDMDTTLLGRVSQSVLPNGLISAAMRRRFRVGATINKSATANQTSEPTAPLSSGVTEDFISNPADKLAYASLTVPHGSVMGVDVAEPDEGADLITVFERVKLAEFGLVGTTTPDVRFVPSRGGLSIEGRKAVPIVGGAVPLQKTPGVSSQASVRRSSRPAARADLKKTKAIDATSDFDQRFVVDESRIISTIPVAVDGGTPQALPLTELSDVVHEKVDPAAVLSVRVRSIVAAPVAAFGDADVPASMSFAPEYSLPTYELLVKIDPELMMPGVGSIPNDTVALANLNTEFVEAFLLGANDELSREFVWREVPVWPQDTWLRTFWASVQETDDIDPVADWDDQPLGTHQPATGLNPDRVLVLLVKGDLLRRYPNTLIYAVPGRWEQHTVDETGDKIWEREEDESRDRNWPIFLGSLGPDVTFLGFQFDFDDVEAVVMGSTDYEQGRPGWFFVFEQPPTEPRFGLDVGKKNRTGTGFRYWKNVSWYHTMGSSEWIESHAPLGVLDGITKPIDESDPDRDDENDFEETWARSAAAMAAITLQRPVRMLVHADQMLIQEEG